MFTLRLEQPSGAVFSKDRCYRYALWRTWNTTLPRVMFVGLNPSTADEQSDDPTIRRCIGFARHWGFGGVIVSNLFAFRATYPSDLKLEPQPIGCDNDRWLQHTANRSALIIACWGTHGQRLQRDQQVRLMLPELCVLAMNKGGTPSHPLYLKKCLKPRPWNVVKSHAA